MIHTAALSVMLLLAVGIRLPFVLKAVFYSSDTAILDLMAMHFLRGEYYFYFWNSGYYGVLDSWILMRLFKWFGSSPQISQTIPLMMSLVFLVVYHRYIRVISDFRTAHVATLLLALPSLFFIHATFVAYSYLVGLSLGLAHFLCIRKIQSDRTAVYPWFLLGLMAGFSWYNHRFIIFFWLASLVTWWLPARGHEDFLFIKRYTTRLVSTAYWKRLLWLSDYAINPRWKRLLIIVNFLNLLNALVALFLWFHGDLPVVFGPVSTKLLFWSTLKISIKATIAVLLAVHWRALLDASKTYWKRPSIKALVAGFLVGYSPGLWGSLMGATPSSPGRLVSLPVIINNFKMLVAQIVPFIADYPGYYWLKFTVPVLLTGLFFLVWKIWRAVRRLGREQAPYLPEIYFLGLINLFINLFAMPLEDGGNGRYLLPLYISILFGLAALMFALPKAGRLVAAAAVVFFLYNSVTEDLREVRAYPMPDPYVVLAKELQDAGIQGGYADYWIAYRVTALTRENVIVAPSGNNDRYEPYQRFVRALSKIVVLGGQEVPAGNIVEIKGQRYKLLQNKPIAGWPAQILERIS